MSLERVADLEKLAVGHALQVEAAGEPICLVRTDDRVVKAVHDTCSHEQWSLSEGWVEGNTIECDLHGSVFDLDTGRPESLPAVKPIPVYACEVRDNGIWVDAEQSLNDAPVPRHF
jgi:3-phenylpropionate/trans-cinnamate dioxygenase ferredoxin subunit